MAEFFAITAQRAEEILSTTVIGASLNAAGHLVLQRASGDVIDAGDFAVFIDQVVQSSQSTTGKVVNYDIVAADTNITISDRFNATNLHNATLVVKGSFDFGVPFEGLPPFCRAGTRFTMVVVNNNPREDLQKAINVGFGPNFVRVFLTTTGNDTATVHFKGSRQFEFFYDGGTWTIFSPTDYPTKAVYQNVNPR